MSDAAASATPTVKVAPPLFALAIFTSAALVFVVQPMITKLVLPQLGGSPAVWNTAMVFFQAALLLGYGYAHALQRVKSLRIQLVTHLVLLVLAALFLPLHVTGVFGEPDSTRPILWLLGVLALSVGAPFAVLSATAPLLQAWYARVRAGEPDAKNPYVLYAASNLGSFIALLAYPAILEPLLRLNTQTLSWTVGYGLFTILAVVLAVSSWGVRTEPEAAPLARTAPIPLIEKARWVLLAAAPSSLMLGVTQHLTTDVASAPFLWVLPLALYLLTFVVAFQSKPAIPPNTTLLLQAVFVSICAWMLPFNTAYWAILFIVHLGTFFFTALMCHQALAARRPPPDRLTEFYLLLSLGGVIGGAFTALLAPVVFDTVREYPLVLLLALFARPLAELAGKRWLVDDGSAALQRGGLHLLLGGFRRLGVLVLSVLFRRVPSDRAGVAAFVPPSASDSFCALAAILLALAPLGLYYAMRESEGLRMLLGWGWVTAGSYTFLAIAGIMAFLARQQRGLMIVALAVVTVAAHAMAGQQRWVAGDRSFFGVLRVAEYNEPRLQAPLHTLMHGTTLHGAQVQGGPNGCLPMLYYSPNTPLGQAMRKMQNAKPEGVTAGVVGLGTGAMAAYVRPQDRLTYYEIDPLVVRFSRGPEAQFTFVDRCAEGPVDIVMGDARVSLAKEPAGKFDILIIDAFSSDAVPTHLLTVEAIQTYLKALKPDGVVVLHLSNRNLEITSPAIAAAKALGVPSLHQIYYEDDNAPLMAEASTEALLLSPTRAGTIIFEVDPRWEQPRPTTVKPWTDDYTNLIGSLWRDLSLRAKMQWEGFFPPREQ